MPQTSLNPQPKRVKTGGRKKAILDAARVEELISIGMKMNDICALTGIPEALLNRRFSSLLRQKRAQAREQLLRKQWDVGLAGDKTMLIWLGKNYAEQTDRQDVTSGGEPIKIVVEKVG